LVCQVERGRLIRTWQSCLGDKKSITIGYTNFRKKLRQVAEDGQPCVDILDQTSGLLCQMVHNESSYGDIAILQEFLMTYCVKVAGLSVETVAEVFAEWNKGELRQLF